MLHWLHSLLPHIPHYGYVLVFIVVFLNNLGFPLPGETILLGAGFVLGKTGHPLWQPVVAGTAASFLGGICAFWMGRRLGHGWEIGTFATAATGSLSKPVLMPSFSLCRDRSMMIIALWAGQVAIRKCRSSNRGCGLFRYSLPNKTRCEANRGDMPPATHGSICTTTAI
jgi:hypothetical protein